MKLKTLLAVAILAHLLVHPGVHAGLARAGSSPQAQPPPSFAQTVAQMAKSLPCPACLAHRSLLALPVVATTTPLEWESVGLLTQASLLSFSLCSRPARAPPLA